MKKCTKNHRSCWHKPDRCKEKKVVITALYRPPSNILHELFVHLIEILEQLVQKDCHIILVENLNINIKENDVATNSYNLNITSICVTECMATSIYQIPTNMAAQCNFTDIISNQLQTTVHNVTPLIPLYYNILRVIVLRNLSEVSVIGICFLIQN
jgi:hypothetical protein